METIPAIQQKIQGPPRQIIIITHTNPDGDALGASLGLAAFFKKKHHTVQVIIPTPYPEFLDWLPGIREVICYETTPKHIVLNLIAQADMIFCVDFGTLNRIDHLAGPIKHAKAIKVVIDHHLDIEAFADYVWWNPQAAAAAELIYELIETWGESGQIDQELAVCLYTGMMTDTACFTTPNTTSRIHRIVANLLEQQVDVAKIHKLIYASQSLKKLQFLGFVLSNRLKVLEEYRTAYIVIKVADAKQFNLGTGDTEGIVNYALSIKGVVLAALIKEKKDEVYLSLRSLGNVPVNTWAQAYFAGGGHKNAAGGISYLPLEQTIAKFEGLVKMNQHILQNA
jgi:phosphoesterase RecJ-like protein